jgi:hypothetical protein
MWWPATQTKQGQLFIELWLKLKEPLEPRPSVPTQRSSDPRETSKEKIPKQLSLQTAARATEPRFSQHRDYQQRNDNTRPKKSRQGRDKHSHVRAIQKAQLEQQSKPSVRCAILFEEAKDIQWQVTKVHYKIVAQQGHFDPQEPTLATTLNDQQALPQSPSRQNAYTRKRIAAADHPYFEIFSSLQ